MTASGWAKAARTKSVPQGQSNTVAKIQNGDPPELGLIAEQILAGPAERDAEGEEPAEE